MHHLKSLLPLGLAIGLALTAGCANKPEPPAPGTPFEVASYEPDMREYHTSWGHTGRGGAALRKPTYQPVLGSLDVLETPAGKLHPELQARLTTNDSVAVPSSMFQANCADSENVAQAFALGQPAASERIVTLANAAGSVDDYIAVRNKLCKGAQRLSYEEWVILVEGTPKDVPLHLKPSFSPSYK
ncbi:MULTISPECIES: hypothetical protein [Pseudomonadaceae]|uniref:Lipoprotein n=3 Tax=Pseudomonas TaxID=286 RepID=A0A4P7YC91_PSEVE|nr:MULTISPECIES: hypothetical protein [Pseudomonas]MCF5507296.1 hypothetical protein [Pseudomonas sp. PA-3-6H]MCF5517741.1 hypothetical protein [Pseudomonas sp. PA-3-6E]MCF5562634.1 hypothetical protein [Pseudomonas sp. PA-3-5D]MCF5565313.1 hypothetical protein [Pseudomonas sp. PA-3-11C]MCF5591534.1 hypothetical protein [Pseudomonas sp. PA-3-10C]